MNEIINQIFEFQDNNDILVTYRKVQAHSGEFGNTKADRLAKNALRGISMNPFY